MTTFLEVMAFGLIIGGLMALIFNVIKASVFGWEATFTNRLRYASRIRNATRNGEIHWKQPYKHTYTAQINGEHMHYCPITGYLYASGGRAYPMGDQEEFVNMPRFESTIRSSLSEPKGLDMENAKTAIDRLSSYKTGGTV